MPHDHEAVPTGASIVWRGICCWKTKVNSAGSVKLQAQEPAGLRELPNEKIEE
jgi:hypothetical protein